MKSTATANPVMTALAVKFMQDPNGFVGSLLFPLFLTAEQSAQYYVFNKENTLNIPTNIQRAPSAPYARSKMMLSDDNYACKEYGHEEPLDDKERKKYASLFAADSAATRRSVGIIRMNHELRCRDKATGAGVPSANPSEKWNNYTDSNPIYDVDVAKKAIRLGCGMRPTLMIISEDVYLVVKEHPAILKKIENVERALITPDHLAAIFGVAKVAVAGAVINGAKEGQAISAADVWGDSVILAHVDPTQDLMAPNFGRTFGWIGEVGPDGVLVESYRQESIKSDVFRARQDTDEKIVGAECGYHIEDVL